MQRPDFERKTFTGDHAGHRLHGRSLLERASDIALRFDDFLNGMYSFSKPHNRRINDLGRELQLNGQTARRSRREEALAAATRLFNRHSFAAVTLEAIADEMGVTPGALYHHFDSKEALVFECFSRGLRIYRDEIARACEPGLDGLETVRRFVRGRLRPGEPRMITFSDLDALPRNHRDAIHDARMGNVAMLRAVIDQGIDDGSIATCDSFLTSLAIFSVLDWMPFWYSESSYYSRQEAAETLDDILTHGVVRRDVPESRPPSPRDVTPLFDRLAEGDKRMLKRDRLLRIATESFNLRGVVGSSLEHIAADAGVSRGAYYYHARDKNSLLHLCLKRAYTTEAVVLGLMLERPPASNDKVEQAIEFEFELLRAVTALHRSPHGPKISFHNVPFLTSAQRADLQADDRALVGRNRGRYERAITEGVFRKIDTLFIQEVGAGLRNSIPAWPRFTAGTDPEMVADGLTRLFLFGLKPRPVGQHPGER
jgi:AcrR family transcriptional regulator